MRDFCGPELEWFTTHATKEPLLSPAQEIELARRIAAMKALREELSSAPRDVTPAERKILRYGERARDRFFRANTRLLCHMAAKYQHKIKHMTMNDLIQEGAFGLSTAIDRFDHERGYKFSTYAYWWIRQGMQRAIYMQESEIRIPIGGKVALAKVRDFVPRYQREHGRMPTIDELAEHTGCRKSTLEGYLQHIPGISSLDAVSDKVEDGDAIVDLIPCKGQQPFDYAEDLDRNNQFQELFKHLKDDQRELITLRYGLSGEAPITQAKAATLIGRSRNGVVELEKKAVRSLRFFSRHGWEVQRECA